MIVKYPTGLYKSAITTDVTFTISSTSPPRTSLLFPKLPPGVEYRPILPKVIDHVARRSDLSNLVFTVNSASRGATATGVKQYEVGQVLDFDVVSSTRTLDPYTAGSYSEIRHDTGLLDYNRLGFTTAQQSVVEVEADGIYRRSEQDLANARQLYSDLQVAISENQKINIEAGKALGALTAMGSSDLTILGMMASLVAKRKTINSERGDLINRANDTAKLAAALLAGLRSMAQVVR